VRQAHADNTTQVADASHNEDVNRVPSLLYLFLIPLAAYPFAGLTPEAARAFDRYAESAEAAMNHDLGFEKIKLRSGEVRIDPGGTTPDIAGGMIQDWRGALFLPNATIQKVKTVLQDYENYKQFYKPEVIESKQIRNQGDDYDVFLRLRKKQILTVVLNTEYHVRYSQPDARRMYVVSRSTRIAEVTDPDRSFTDEEPVGHDSGFLWRLNSYWQFKEADGGVYAGLRAISLSRDVPVGLGWMIKGFVAKFPKESMLNTLRGTKAAVEGHSSF
jgi:hypothetical protein